MCISIVVVCVCVFSNLCAFMQVRSTEVEINSGWRICADDPTRRRFFYMTCGFCCFCFAFAVPASGELQKTSEGPEFRAGPEERQRISEVLNSGRGQRTLTTYRLMGFVHYIKFQHCFYRRTNKMRQVSTCCVYCRAGRDFVH